jgi:hypothetical protein
VDDPVPTRSQVRKAGTLLREYGAGHALFDQGDVQDALSVLVAYRTALSRAPYALTRASMGLRSMANTISVGAEVSQRLKRVDRIIEKLGRFPQMQLETMEDIGGCRAVVASLDDLAALRSRITTVWGSAITRERDYITKPKATGYRAVHIVVAFGGPTVEVQLRTRRQQAWARTVEAAETTSRTHLKDGIGDPATLRFLRDLGDAASTLDRGEPLPEHLREIVQAGADPTGQVPSEKP